VIIDGSQIVKAIGEQDCLTCFTCSILILLHVEDLSSTVSGDVDHFYQFGLKRIYGYDLCLALVPQGRGCDGVSFRQGY
jgi:hypothetical protein